MAFLFPHFPAGDDYIDGLRMSYHWALSPFDAGLTFSFPQAAADYPNDYDYGGGNDPNWPNSFQQVSLEQQDAVRAILLGTAGTDVITATSVVSFTNLPILEVGGGLGDIRVGQFTGPPTAHAVPLDPFWPDAQGDPQGDVWFGTANNFQYRNPVAGSYAYQTHIHELGHALGLKHPHQDVDGVGTDDPRMPEDRDAKEFTVMSYRDYVGDNGPNGLPDDSDSRDYPQTFMMYDILALQTMYGADYGPESNNGDTTYAWLPTTGETFIGPSGSDVVSQGTTFTREFVNGNWTWVPGDTIFLTIWDGGGIDTYDMSWYQTHLEIDLAPGSWSITSPDQLARLEDNHTASGNVYNALLFNGDTRSLIENAWGGSGDDSIFGNQTGNALYGYIGNDILSGREGGDVLVGGPGNDTLNGGDGNDSAWFTGNLADYSLFLDAGGLLNVVDTRANSPDGTDTLFSMEILQFPVETLEVQQGGAGTDFLAGGNSSNWLDGGAGDDFINGSGGDDLLIGGDGNDLVVGGDGNDALFEGGVVGGDDTLMGGAGDDTLGDARGTNTLDGGSGDDVLFAGFNDDVLIGGDGNDTVSYRYGSTLTPPAGVTVNLGLIGPQDTLGSGFDTLSEIENLTGSAMNDTLTGSGGDNVLEGLDNNDVLSGGAGNDRLVGGAGFDTLTGGSGNDILTGGADLDEADYGGTLADYSFTQNAEDLLTVLDKRLSSPDGTDTVSSIELFRFADQLLSLQEGGPGDDILTGTLIADLLLGNGGDDVLNGRGGNDTLLGGAGISDTAIYSGTLGDYFFTQDGDGPFTVTDLRQNTPDGTDTVGGMEFLQFADQFVEVVTGGPNNDTLFAGGSALLVGNGGDDTLIGGFGFDFLFGSSGSDVLVGGAYDDILDGGAGIDTASFLNSLAAVNANLANFVALVADGSEDGLIRIENVIGSAFDDTLVGDANANLLDGADGNDDMTGGAGDDQLIGSVGTDIARYFGNLADYSLTLHVDPLDPLLGTWTVADNRMGSPDGTDTLGGVETFRFADIDREIGSDANIYFNGSGRPQVFIGGAGQDTVSYDNFPIIITTGFAVSAQSTTSRSGLVASLADPTTNTGWAAGDTYVSIENLIGSRGDDKLSGDNNDNTLEGGQGADELFGGNGIDTASYEHAAGAVTASLSRTNINTGAAAGDSYSSIENLIGSAFNDELIGNVQSNVLEGGAGADRLFGGGGADTASYAHATSGVIADLSQRVQNTGAAAGDSYSSIQNLLGSTFADKLTGNDEANVLEGGLGADQLNGREGSDTASYEHATGGVTADLSNAANNTGEAAGDTYTSIENLLGSGFDDHLVGDALNNVLTGGGGDDILLGNDGKDELIGGLGADSLNGGVGKDRLTGGLGADLYVWGAVALLAANADAITDYTFAEGDKIDLQGLVPDISAGFAIDYVHVRTNGSDLLVEVDPDGTSGRAKFTTAYTLSGTNTGGTDTVRFSSGGHSWTITDTNVVASVTDPIIFDLGTKGISFTSFVDGVQFDINGDGAPDQIAWTTGDDGILAYDLNGSGVIENGSEIFSPFLDGGSFSSSLTALASLDSNSDGMIDGSDAGFGDLLVWQDQSHDGVSDTGELSTLTDFGITSISLSALASQAYIDGQAVFSEGSFTYADGTASTFLEVSLDTQLGATPALTDPEVGLLASNDPVTAGAETESFVVADAGQGTTTEILSSAGNTVVTAGDSLVVADAGQGTTTEVSSSADNTVVTAGDSLAFADAGQEPTTEISSSADAVVTAGDSFVFADAGQETTTEVSSSAGGADTAVQAGDSLVVADASQETTTEVSSSADAVVTAGDSLVFADTGQEPTTELASGDDGLASDSGQTSDGSSDVSTAEPDAVIDQNVDDSVILQTDVTTSQHQDDLII